MKIQAITWKSTIIFALRNSLYVSYYLFCHSLVYSYIIHAPIVHAYVCNMGKDKERAPYDQG